MTRPTDRDVDPTRSAITELICRRDRLGRRVGARGTRGIRRAADSRSECGSRDRRAFAAEMRSAWRAMASWVSRRSSSRFADRKLPLFRSGVSSVAVGDGAGGRESGEHELVGDDFGLATSALAGDRTTSAASATASCQTLRSRMLAAMATRWGRLAGGAGPLDCIQYEIVASCSA